MEQDVSVPFILFLKVYHDNELGPIHNVVIFLYRLLQQNSDSKNKWNQALSPISAFFLGMAFGETMIGGVWIIIDLFTKISYRLMPG